MMEWLKQQPDVGAESQLGDTFVLTLLETVKVNHFDRVGLLGLGTRFTVSELSGAIGIASVQDNPSLSIMYPGTDKSPLILSREDGYGSALFITISGQEYLAAASMDGIHLWNLAKSKSRVVYKFKEEGFTHMCRIDEKTVVCVAEQISPDDFIHTYILKTDAEMWSLSSTHLMKVKNVCDMLYVKTTDGTPCLLQVSSKGDLVQSVELVGGKVRWQLGKEQIGEYFLPWSICTDDNIVFVANFALKHLHLLSVDDGSVLTSVNLRPFGIYILSAVYVQREIICMLDT